jgi:hypothetical protein
MEYTRASAIKHVTVIRWLTGVYTLLFFSFIVAQWFFKNYYASEFGFWASFEITFFSSFLIGAYAIWITWTKLPKKRHRKWNDTIFLVFFGIIGLWMWMPSTSGLNRLFKQNENRLFVAKY